MTPNDSSPNASENHRRHSPTHSNPDIRFPTLTVNSSLASLASAASSTADNMPKSNDAAPSGLEDSCYEIVDDMGSENEDGRTASLTSGASVDGDTPDDLMSLAGTEVSINIDDEQDVPRAPQAVEALETSISESVEAFETSTNESGDEGLSRSLESINSLPDVCGRLNRRERIDDSDLTTRPSTPLPEPHMAPSLSALPVEDLPEADNENPPSTFFGFPGIQDKVASFVTSISAYLCRQDSKARFLGIQDKVDSFVIPISAYLRRQDSKARTVRVLGSQILLGALGAFLLTFLMSNFSIKHEVTKSSALPSPPPAATVMSDYVAALAASNHRIEYLEDRIRIMERVPRIRPTPIILPDKIVGQTRQDTFTAKTMGDNYIIVTAPTPFRHFTKTPEVKIAILRSTDNTRVEAAVTVHDGVYVVCLDPEQAHGALTVHVKSSNPNDREEFDVDFGSPWLKMSRYATIATRMYSNAHDATADFAAWVSAEIEHVSKPDSLVDKLKDADFKRMGKEVAKTLDKAQKQVAKAFVTVKHFAFTGTDALIGSTVGTLREKVVSTPNVVKTAQKNARTLLAKLKTPMTTKDKKKGMGGEVKRGESKWGQWTKIAAEVRESLEAELTRMQVKNAQKQESKRSKADKKGAGSARKAR